MLCAEISSACQPVWRHLRTCNLLLASFPAAGALALREPLVDVRVAAWLSTPDDKKLKVNG